MHNGCNEICHKLQNAHKESILQGNTLLQDILLDVLTDMKQFCKGIKNVEAEKKTTRYTNEQVRSIVKVLLQLAKNEISNEEAKDKIKKISDRFPLHSLSQYKRVYQDALEGRGRYGFAFPSNWAEILLQETNNDPLVIKALREQMSEYLKRDGKENTKLKNLLDSLELSDSANNALEGMSIDERRHAFRNWAITQVQHETTIEGYIKSLDYDFPLELQMDTIFSITNINELQSLHRRCGINGDLYSWNRSIVNGRPSAALNKYIQFLLT